MRLLAFCCQRFTMTFAIAWSECFRLCSVILTSWRRSVNTLTEWVRNRMDGKLVSSFINCRLPPSLTDKIAFFSRSFVCAVVLTRAITLSFNNEASAVASTCSLHRWQNRFSIIINDDDDDFQSRNLVYTNWTEGRKHVCFRFDIYTLLLSF